METEKKIKVLIIEDDEDVVDTITLAFQVGWPGSKSISTPRGKKGVDMVRNENPDVVILDLGLPDTHGFEVLREIRSFSSVPIVILTVMIDEDDTIKGLEWGADDYINKPFRKMELLARVKTILRRQGISSDLYPLAGGPLRFDPLKYKFFYQEKEVTLTVIETKILYSLLEKQNQVVTYSNLAKMVWGNTSPGLVGTLRVHIGHLRKKLEDDPNNPFLIINKPGIGYCLETTR